eukprot:CAMPEP_0173391636 /NCGR_PEP_ID=MMETSP1356-20130122/18498_1 /TAXON_ID=77927 ORGANISM="Hemiselmis virescens, Strain PCC157" /NCGR_SAMPLE_ID=MMETSP1356 /ASSEMBLY_ACC=CAM_ASM_000847 /LENGTH=190 /DNA_ID=CAMNT_0014349297 /DNA_START=151 /DNA_END=719 /DNA_ORIENTATION=-
MEVPPPPASAAVEAKVVVLGETNVGKTCMVFRFVEGKFVPHGASTIGASFMVKKLNMDGAKVTMQIWDTAGQERFRSMAPMYYRGAAAAVLVIDVTNPDSFGKVRSWVDELKRNASEDIIMVIACNKCDLTTERVVKQEDVAEYAKGIGAACFETSAATNKGIDDVFVRVAKGLVERHRRSESAQAAEGG